MKDKEIINLGKWNEEQINSLLSKAYKIKDIGIRIAFISRVFLGVVYKKSTLIGDVKTPEVLVINFEGMDCFTFIDYVETLAISKSFTIFKDKLKRIRYKNGEVDYKKRNHFFTDWIDNNSEFIEDVTEDIGGAYTEKLFKKLNLTENNRLLLEAIEPRPRTIKYIPSLFLSQIKDRLKTGDYIGIYSDNNALDVAHVGIIIIEQGNIYFRHASSLKKMVIDEDLEDYLKDKSGIIVLRPKSVSF